MKEEQGPIVGGILGFLECQSYDPFLGDFVQRVRYVWDRRNLNIRYNTSVTMEAGYPNVGGGLSMQDIRRDSDFF
ncbi:unnamed protein product [Bursaphelenchus xylophilus]|uniref:(pine wood nematode) hypothetical protein n=1 Tax=Bursaphelenchus xylophilus TaxID=6326 RepID=A0A1I7S6P1_BURXY|nr:unnamed protein product [Bursaphelenchus xylophilus]CAG9120632.1 unnamed protein product [Bursaphelenchus xylophilus]